MHQSDPTARRLAATSLLGATALALTLAACATSGTTPPTTAASLPAASPAESAAASVEASAAASADGAQTVTITGTSFGQAELTVSAGETVTFVNDSALSHTVTEGQNGSAADDARFDEQVAAGDSVEVTFADAGDYDVTCLFHPNMNLVVHAE